MKTVLGLLWLLMIESFVVKSVIFDRNDPIMAHYLISGTLISMLLIFVALRRSLLDITFRLAGSRTFIVLLTWLLLATATRVNALEVSAVVGFAMLVLCFYFTLPVICDRLNLSLRRLVLPCMVASVLTSAAMLVLYPVESYELPSLRFRGAFISVAVACNVLFYACVYLTWAAKRFSGRWRWFYSGVAALSYVLLLLTFTKSSILQATLGVLLLLLTNFYGRFVLKRLMIFLCALITLSITVLPSIDMNAVTENLRIIDNNVLASRDLNWEQGLNRAMDNMVLGTGLLTKQTKGGSEDLKISSDNYDPSFDAHSLGISLAEQSGIPFMLVFLLMLALPLWQFVRQFGWRHSLQVPEFNIMLITVPSMMLSGGDMVSLGSVVNRMQWLFLGALALDVLHARRQERSRI